MHTALPELLDVNELARHLGVNVRHIRRLVAERRIPFIKWGHLLRFDPDEIVDWLEYNRRRIEARPVNVTGPAYDSRALGPRRSLGLDNSAHLEARA